MFTYYIFRRNFIKKARPHLFGEGGPFFNSVDKGYLSLYLLLNLHDQVGQCGDLSVDLCDER